MESLARVRKINDDGTAQVIPVGDPFCAADCSRCCGCAADADQNILLAHNPIGAKAGELVKLRTASAPVWRAALVLYVLPVVLFFAGYPIGRIIWSRGAPAGCAALLVGIGIAIIYDRLVAAKKKPVYTIIGYPDEMLPET